MQKNSVKNTVMLLLAAMIWGFAFVAQSTGMNYVGPYTFNAVRSFMGSFVLFPVAFLGKQKFYKMTKQEKKELLLSGSVCGILLGTATNLQQIGIMTTSVGKAGFLTALYIVLVPIAGLFLKKKCGKNVWIGVGCSFIGLYLLCMTDSSKDIAIGDVYLLSCAIVFTFHILVIDYFAPKVNGVQMSCIQFLVAGILSSVFMFSSETPSLISIWEAKLPLLYAGVLSSGVAYTLQILGQKNYNPTIAVLILSLESSFSVLGGFLILKETLSMRESIGCLLMFVAIILAQLPSKSSCKENIT